jgi:hypothetical protein
MTDKNSTEKPIENTDTLDKSSSNVTPKEKNDSVINVDRRPRLTMRPPRTQHPKSDDENSVDKESLTSEPEDEDPFDALILSNFHPFSGSENVIEWLDVTDDKFNLLTLSRKSRYAAIPLLVKGEAKRAYLDNKKTIQTYDDFYTFLLTQYATSKDHAPRPTAHSVTSTVVSQENILRNIPPQKSVGFDDQQTSSNKTFDILDGSLQPPILRSTAIHDLGATDVIEGAPVSRSNILPSQNSFFNASQLDQTTHVLRRAIVDSLIKNPKTFRGGKEDVKQWLEDIEQSFDTAQIHDSIKLDLVQHSLRGEALRWFKNNKSTFASWTDFVKGLKEMFLSPFYQEIAFKKLESYTQGVNQPIRSFYNEVFKLCNEADPSMSDSSKLRHLLNKTNPSLQFEIRLKRPTTTKQYLDYAIEIEELFHLSHIDTSNNPNKSNNPTFPTASAITFRHSNSPSPPDKTVPSVADREVHFDKTYNNSKSNYRNNNNSFSRSFLPSNTMNRSNHGPRHQWPPPPQQGNPYSQDARHQQGGHLHSISTSSTAPSKPPHRRTYNSNNPTYNNNNQRKTFPPGSEANNTSHANIPSLLDPLLSSSPVTCSRCSQQGHLPTECPHF